MVQPSIRVLFGFVLGIALIWGCSERGPSSPTTHGGNGGAGGCPVRLPEPQFVVEIRADEGPVPIDTRVVVEWSAANEPPFVLSDPTTWKTLDDGVNLVCNIDRTQPPPTDLAVLVCELWTSGAVNLMIDATGFTPYTETLTPMMSETCNEPMPMDVSVTLSHPMADAGAEP